ncbi:MAG: hypothetical protein KTR16_15260 [Acidiferrobacterales bacterium]|nr:hypothetical protein [Acidiferrobacterales bacterium]
MTERREPIISNLKSEPDEAARRRQSAQPPQVTARNSSRPPPPAYARPSEKKSALAAIALVFAMAGIGFAGFLYWQLMEAKKVIAAADLRIIELESKFELSDDESSASVTALQAKLKWADTEIRKLWGVSYDTNRKNIESNKKELASIQKTVKAVNSTIKSKFGDVQADIKLVNDLVDAQQSSLSSIEKQNRAVLTSVDQMKSQNSKLQGRIKSNEEALESIDAFRRTVNQRLLDTKSTTP